MLLIWKQLYEYNYTRLDLFCFFHYKEIFSDVNRFYTFLTKPDNIMIGTYKRFFAQNGKIMVLIYPGRPLKVWF